MKTLLACVVVVLGIVGASLRAQIPNEGVLDRLLHLCVRDGLVYYAALDRFVSGIGDELSGSATSSPDAAKAFWLNAYNALVLKTVVDHYPIRGQAPEYPPDSIRQIPGAFEERTHRVAGRALTLDAIESEVLTTFDDPRLFLALGRGAVGAGRLRSEAYTAPRLTAQLEAVVEEDATLPRYVDLDRLTKEVRVSAVYGDRGWSDSGWTSIERAILTLIEPALFPSERTFLAANEFALRYQSFDWRLNDLTGGRP